MGSWEFFLQKVGDENWLKVETFPPKFPNGRYDIAARAAHRPHETIEVSISTYPTPQAPERKQIQKHSCKLDRDGFGVLTRDIRLTPGIWEIQCRGDLLSELMGEDWEVTLSLSMTWRFEPILPASGRDRSLLSETGEDLETLRSRLDHDADRMLEEIVTEFFPSFTTNQEGEGTPPQSENGESDYSLQLDEDILIAQANKPIIVSGQITTGKHPPHPKFCLKITLHDPRTGELVGQLFPRLRDQPFPLTFCYSLTLPTPCDSYVLQGEITLCEATPDHEGVIFARQPSTVSAHWEKLKPALTEATPSAGVSHPPAPLSPISAKDRLLSPPVPRWRGVFPPQLSRKRDRKKKKETPPTLPKLPHSSSSKPKEYVWSKPEGDPQWELIEELVIVSTDNNPEQ